MQRFTVLFRTFFAQLFTTELASSEIQLRQVMIWVLAFLATPGLFILLHVGFFWDRVVTQPASVVDGLLAQLGVLFVTHSIVSTGFVAVLVWDALSFSRRDAMVLGTMPVSGGAIVAAKLAALAAFLVGAAAAINLPSAGLFAVMTGNRLGLSGVVRHCAAHASATIGAGIFVFGVVASIRGAIALLVGTRVATSAGFWLQFLFVGVLLWFFISIPSAMTGGTPWMLATGAVAWLPTTWFLGVFEALIGSSLPAAAFATRGVMGVAIAIAAGALVVGIGFRRQMRLALAPPAVPSDFLALRCSLASARLLAGGHPVARATCEFILVTIARNRAQQAPIAINGAVGLAVVVAALSSAVETLDGLRHLRLAVLWMPLVFVYWTAIGLRAACFIPSELPASWAFRMNGSTEGTAYSSAIRASMLVFLVPRAVVLSLLLTPLVGWRIAVVHAVFAGTVTVLIAQVAAQTIAFVPFTREYRPGHARLKLLWPVYLAGLYLFAYLPARLELNAFGDPRQLAALIGSAAVTNVVAWLIARKVPTRIRAASDGVPDEVDAASLGITSVATGGHLS